MDFDDIRKSIYSTLYERASSPLWGTFIVSWCVWNWKIFYVTLFVPLTIIPDKLGYIVDNHSSWHDYFLVPFCSTVALILIVPFVSWAALWVSLFHRDQRIKLKQKRDDKLLLTEEQSAQIRRQLALADKELNDALDLKDIEIKQLIENSGRLGRELQELKKSLGAPGVVAATYGTLTNYIDVTEIVSKAVARGNSIKASHEWLGISDPHPGQRKNLSVFIFKSVGGSKLMTAREGETIDIGMFGN